ncbi:MAG: hypothetical protein V3571_01195 [Pseudodesulfovibrio sp.]
MSDLKEFADQLQQEVVSDMAEAYFGARKDLEEMIDAFGLWVEELRIHGPKLFEAAARLHRLLLDRETARDFYIALDVVPSCIPFPDEPPRPFFDRLPFAFTTLGRYERCVFKAYELFHLAADEYLNGRYYDDPDQRGRKRLTVHYVRLKALAEHLNGEIDKVNRRSVCNALQYIKSMDPDKMRHERVMGDIECAGGDALNQDLQFAPIDFEGLGLPVVQDLPSLYKVRDAIKAFCADIYPARREDIRRAMDSLIER